MLVVLRRELHLQLVVEVAREVLHVDRQVFWRPQEPVSARRGERVDQRHRARLAGGPALHAEDRVRRRHLEVDHPVVHRTAWRNLLAGDHLVVSRFVEGARARRPFRRQLQRGPVSGRVGRDREVRGELRFRVLRPDRRNRRRRCRVQPRAAVRNCVVEGGIEIPLRLLTETWEVVANVAASGQAPAEAAGRILAGNHGVVGIRVRRRQHPRIAAQRLPLGDDLLRLLGHDVDHAGKRVGAVHRRGRTVDDFNSIDVGQRKLSRQPRGRRGQVVVLDTVDQQHRPVGLDRAIAALVDVRIGRAGAAGEIESGKVAQHRLEVGVAAPLDLGASDHRDGGRRLGEWLLRLRDRGHGRRRVTPLDEAHEPHESRRVEDVGLELGVGSEQTSERRLGRRLIILGEGDPGQERQRPAALDPRRLGIETRERGLTGRVELPLGEQVGRGPELRFARLRGRILRGRGRRQKHQSPEEDDGAQRGRAGHRVPPRPDAGAHADSRGMSPGM